MNMTATVLRVNPGSLLVRNEANGEEVLVNYANAGRFRPGERVRINYSGQMTFSIPPQISASSVQRIAGVPRPPQPGPGPAPGPGGPSEMRGTVLQRGRNFLIVRNNQNRQQFRVDFAQAHHFCVRQQVIVRYNTLTFGNPPRLSATDITPIC